eukprot:Skav230360  [mRNA]  locus=scaffold291:36567:41015:- [translate_table: standard]
MGGSPWDQDAAFKNGGRWVIKLEKVKAQSLDDLWLSLSLALIGEATGLADEKKIMAIGREYRNARALSVIFDVLASTPGLQELATKASSTNAGCGLGMVTGELMSQLADEAGVDELTPKKCQLNGSS